MIKLLEKSNRNMEAAEWAEDKEYWEVAASRIYYSIFQKLLYINHKYKYVEPLNGKDSHIEALKFFMSNVKLNGKEKAAMKTLKQIKQLRVDSDYKKVHIDKYTYKYKLTHINEILAIFKKEGA